MKAVEENEIMQRRRHSTTKNVSSIAKCARKRDPGETAGAAAAAAAAGRVPRAGCQRSGTAPCFTSRIPEEMSICVKTYYVHTLPGLTYNVAVDNDGMFRVLAN